VALVPVVAVGGVVVVTLLAAASVFLYVKYFKPKKDDVIPLNPSV
jgi:hypothetical protein